MIRSRRSRLASVTARLPQILAKLDETADHLNELLGEDNRKGDCLKSSRISAPLVAQRIWRADTQTGTVLAMTTPAEQPRPELFRARRVARGAVGRHHRFRQARRNLSDTNHQLQQALQDARPGLRNFSQRTLTDVSELVGEARQLIAGLGRLVAGLDRDPSRVLFGDRRKGYRPQ